MGKKVVVEFFQGESRLLLALVIGSQFEKLKFSQSIIAVAGVEGAADSFLTGGFLFVVTIKKTQ